MLHPIGGLTEFQRRQLLGPIGPWLFPLSDTERLTITNDARKALREWADKQGDLNGMVTIPAFGMGLLSGPPTETKHHVSELEPWQCAGPLVANNIDLALKLLDEGDPTFADVTKRHGLQNVMAMIGADSLETANFSSLLNLNTFFVWEMIQRLEAARKAVAPTPGKKQPKDFLPQARERSAQVRKARKEQDLDRIRSLALDYALKHPRADLDDLVKYVMSFDGINLTRSTVKLKLSGIITAARAESKRPRTDLYATVQKR